MRISPIQNYFCYNGLKFSERTDVMLFQYSEISFHLLNQNDKPMLMRPKM